MLEITYSSEAARALSRMAANRARTIRQKIRQYAADPASQENNVIRLTGSTDYRMRVGDYRVVFSRTDLTMDVKIVAPRGRAYR